MNLYEYFDRQADRQPNAPAIKDPNDDDLTYADLEQRAGAIAAWLNERTDVGDRVAIYMMDNPTYVAAVLGAWRSGCVVTPVNYRFGTDEVKFVLEDVRPRVLLADDIFATTAEEVADHVDAVEDMVIAHADGTFEERAFGDPQASPEPVGRFDDDAAIVMHTSGTTGQPKGVIQTHRNIGAQVDAGIGRYDVSASDTAVVSVPLFHVGGLHGATLMSLFAGGSVVIQPAWEGATWGRLVAATNATFSGLVPAMIVDVLNTDEARECDTSSLRLCFYGGSPAPEPLLEEFEEAFEIDSLLDYYGQTEAAGVTVTYEAGAQRRPGKMGTPIETVDAEVVDLEDRTPVEPGEMGELRLRGDTIMPEYWEAPTRTEEVFDGDWFHTGDVVRPDADGYLAYVDRVDDVILSGGEKVAPSRVENALSAIDSVESVAVFGTPHDRLGEAVTAAIISADESLMKADVETFCESRDDLAGYEKPRRVTFVESFPRTGSQKIDKVALAERVEETFV
jgi:long-chain acyl-CoA synthetase